MSSDRYKNSIHLLARAEKSIPLGSQTFSKSKTQFPVGGAPLFTKRGEGPYLFDEDDHQYVDFVCSLGAITHGYGDQQINEAVEKQLRDGVVFSMPHRLETEVAEKVIEMIPSAEKVRFGKNGSDATAGCIRLARAFTRRDRVAICGYHGWQDWYIGTTTRDQGVPKATKDLSSLFAYNDLENLSQLLSSHPGEFACIIMEPVAFSEPDAGYLDGVKELAHAHGALLIFDEVVTGFRLAEGSAQQRYNIEPDLTAFGKGVANGFPLSIVAGRSDVMALMEEVFFSFTMGGEALSLASASAVLDKIRFDGSLTKLDTSGRQLLDGVKGLLRENELEGILDCIGRPCWSLFVFNDTKAATSMELKTLFIQECSARGVFNIGLHFIGTKHNSEVINDALKVYGEVFPILADAAENGMADKLYGKVLEPLFKVR